MYLSRFIGRDRELDELARVLDAGQRLVTVTGPAGIGKTRLTLEYVRARDGGAPLAVVCDMTEARSVEDVVAALARAIAPSAPPAPAAQRLIETGKALAARGDAVIVIDNFEQVAAHAHATLAPLLTAAPGARLLITSREQLKLDGEVVFELGPLALPAAGHTASDATLLFLDRAARVRRGYLPTPSDAEAIAEIVRRLDGIPLAIELCACRMNVLGPEALLGRLSERLDLLRRGGPGEARVKTLRAAIDGSWDLLEPGERRAFAQCAVFRGGFTADAAEVILERAPDETASTLDTIQALRDRSMLYTLAAARPSTDLRLGLYLSLRDYAAEKLERSGAAGPAYARHARHYLALGEAWASDADAGKSEALDRLALERENIALAVERMIGAAAPPADHATLLLQGLVTIGAALELYGGFDGRLDAFDQALGASEVDPRLRARARRARARIFRRRGCTAEAVADLREALGASEQIGDATLEAHVLSELGVAYVVRSQQRQAKECFDRARERYAAAADTAGEARVLLRLSFIETPELGADERLAFAGRARDLLRRHGDARAEAQAAYSMGLIQHDQGRLKEAIALYQQALRGFEALGDRWGEGACLAALGVTHQLERRGYEGRQLLDAALERVADLDAALRVILLAHRGGIAAELGEIDLAERLLDEAERAAVGTDGPYLDVVIGLQRGLVDLAIAAKAGPDANEKIASARRHLAAAKQRAPPANTSEPDEPPVAPESSLDVRWGMRVLERALRDVERVGGATVGAPAAPLVVDARGRWFQPPGGERVPCNRRQASRLLLLHLAEQRVRAPGAPQSSRRLLGAGWPGERLLPDAARNRLHVTLSLLRRLGLRDLLIATDDGYFFDPDVPLILVDEPASPS